MRDTKKNGKVPEFLREPLEAVQARLESFEDEAQKVIEDLMKKGRQSRKDLAVLVKRLSKQDWNMDDLRGRFGKLREQGKERASELRGRAESFRTEAMETLEDLQSKAIAYLGVATREQVLALSSELEKLARRLERADVKAGSAHSAPAKKIGKKSSKRAAQG